jgi:hypothetical protein
MYCSGEIQTFLTKETSAKTNLKFSLKLKKIHAPGVLSETELSQSPLLLLTDEGELNK